MRKGFKKVVWLQKEGRERRAAEELAGWQQLLGITEA